MYEQKYIDIFDEQKYKDIITGKKSFRIDMFTKDSKDQMFLLCFQHYLLKSYANGYEKEACRKILNDFFRELVKYPYMFCDSPLIKDQTISYMTESGKQRITELRRNFFGASALDALIIKKRNGAVLSETEEQQYYSSLIIRIKNGNKKYDETIEREIKELLQKDVKSLSYIQLKFYCTRVAYFAKGTNNNYNLTLMIGNDSSNCFGYQNSDYIFINKRKLESFAQVTCTTCHETRHSVQEHQASEMDTKAGFEMAQTDLFFRYLNTATYDSYHDNYTYSSIELDAENSGYTNAAIFLSMFGSQEHIKAVYSRKEKSFNKRDYYMYMKDESGHPCPVDDFIATRMDRIILSHPEELNKYPLLRKIYNSDGTRKSFEKLFQVKIDEGINNRGIIDNYLIHDIKQGELDNYKLSGKSRDQIDAFAHKLTGILYRDVVCDFLRYVNDKGIGYSDEQMIKTTKDLLRTMIIILEYFNKYYNTLQNPELIDFTQRDCSMDMIYHLRDFDISKIKNPVLRNNKEVIDRLLKAKAIVNDISRKRKVTILNSKVIQMPSNIRYAVLDFPGTGPCRFQDWLYNYVLPNLDSHENMVLDRKQMKVYDIIKSYTEFIKQCIDTYGMVPGEVKPDGKGIK